MAGIELDNVIRQGHDDKPVKSAGSCVDSIVKFSLYVSLSYSVMLYFKCNGHLSMYSFSSSPRRRFVLQTEISGKYILLFILYLNSVSYSTPCRKDQLTVYQIELDTNLIPRTYSPFKLEDRRGGKR